MLTNIYFYINKITFSSEVESIKTFIIANAAILLSYYIFIKVEHFKIFKTFGIYSLNIYLMHDFLVPATRMAFKKFAINELWLYLTVCLIFGSCLPIIIGKFCKNKGILNFPFAPLNTIKGLK